MVVAVRLQLVLDQCRVDRIDRCLLGLNAVVGGKRAGRWIAPHRGDRGRCDRSDIDEAGVGVGTRLHRPSFDTAGACRGGNVWLELVLLEFDVTC